MRVLEQSGTMGNIPKTAGADHVVADQSEVAAFLATTSVTHKANSFGESCDVFGFDCYPDHGGALHRGLVFSVCRGCCLVL